jgi:hypothetical protein
VVVGEVAPVTIRLGGGVVTLLWALLGACPFRAFERGRVDAPRLGGERIRQCFCRADWIGVSHGASGELLQRHGVVRMAVRRVA